MGAFVSCKKPWSNIFLAIAVFIPPLFSDAVALDPPKAPKISPKKPSLKKPRPKLDLNKTIKKRRSEQDKKRNSLPSSEGAESGGASERTKKPATDRGAGGPKSETNSRARPGFSEPKAGGGLSTDSSRPKAPGFQRAFPGSADRPPAPTDSSEAALPPRVRPPADTLSPQGAPKPAAQRATPLKTPPSQPPATKGRGKLGATGGKNKKTESSHTPPRSKRARPSAPTKALQQKLGKLKPVRTKTMLPTPIGRQFGAGRHRLSLSLALGLGANELSHFSGFGAYRFDSFLLGLRIEEARWLDTNTNTGKARVSGEIEACALVTMETTFLVVQPCAALGVSRGAFKGRDLVNELVKKEIVGSSASMMFRFVVNIEPLGFMVDGAAGYSENPFQYGPFARLWFRPPKKGASFGIDWVNNQRLSFVLGYSLGFVEMTDYDRQKKGAKRFLLLDSD